MINASQTGIERKSPELPKLLFICLVLLNVDLRSLTTRMSLIVRRYVSLIQSILEYGRIFWSPQKKISCRIKSIQKQLPFALGQLNYWFSYQLLFCKSPFLLWYDLLWVMTQRELQCFLFKGNIKYPHLFSRTEPKRKKLKPYQNA